MWQKISQSGERNNNKCIIMHNDEMQIQVSHLLFLKSISKRGGGTKWEVDEHKHDELIELYKIWVRKHLVQILLNSPWYRSLFRSPARTIVHPNRAPLWSLPRRPGSKSLSPDANVNLRWPDCNVKRNNNRHVWLVQITSLRKQCHSGFLNSVKYSKKYNYITLYSWLLCVLNISTKLRVGTMCVNVSTKPYMHRVFNSTTI